MSQTNESNNPYDLCNLNPQAGCDKCSLRARLDCHFSRRKLFRFMVSFLLIIAFGSLALLANGFLGEFYTFLIVLGIFSVIFFEFWEIRILCSHCPFYAENKKTLHCCANYGSFKVWPYRPGPMSRSEKIQLIIGFMILVFILLYPAMFLTGRGIYLWALLPVIGLLQFGYVLRKYHCAKCFNFSCPFNPLPRNVVDAFLKLNPVMEAAWRKGKKR